MEKFKLLAKVRDPKATASSLRAQGLVPCELYGNKVENMHLVATRSEIEKLYRKAGATSIVEVEIEGVGTRPVILHDLQRHYLTDELDHADFYQVNLTEKIRASVPLKIVGESRAIREQAGVLMELVREVEVESLPQDIPHELEVDISKLESFDDVVLVSDIKVPSNVTILTEAEEAVAKVQAPRNLEEELAVPAQVVSAADVEVEKKGKKEEETPE